MAGAGGVRTSKRKSWRRASDSNDLHRMQGLLALFRWASREEVNFRPRLTSQISRYRGWPVGRRNDAPGPVGVQPKAGSNRILGGEWGKGCPSWGTNSPSQEVQEDGV